MSKKSEILEELEQIAERHNRILRASDVLEFAKNENTALHSRFEWDDKKAGEEYRLWQARELIRVNVIMLPDEETGKEVSIWVSMKEDRQPNSGGGYRYLEDVLSDAEYRARLLTQARDDFKAWQKKYQTLKELEPVFAAMDEIATETAIVEVKQKAKRKPTAKPQAMPA